MSTEVDSSKASSSRPESTSDSLPPTPRSSSFTAALSQFPFDRPRYSPHPSTADLPRSLTSRPRTAEHALTHRPSNLREPFAAPAPRPTPATAAAPADATKLPPARPRSTMLVPGEPLEKPWLATRDPNSRYAYIITYAVAALGLVASALRIYFGYRGALLLTPNELCLVMDEQFTSDDAVFGPNGNWLREVDMSGFGNGEFEMTTASENNSFVRDGQLYIVPTLTADAIGAAAVFDGYTYNATGCTFNLTGGASYTSSTCTLTSCAAGGSPSLSTDGSTAAPFDAADYLRACSAVSNATTGAIIPPIQSARLSTRGKASIRFGRVEIRARLPRGDWLWPALWMLPADDAYGAWPRSGEIDIMEARGNGMRYPRQGINYVRGSLNWGPTPWLNAVAKTFGAWGLRRTGYDAAFHTYVLEWTDQFIRISVDSRLQHMLDLRLGEPFFARGEFPPVIQNGTDSIALSDPWVNGTRGAAPFDQQFYLIMNVAVGGTNGWFPDRIGDKPWLDGSATAMRDFALKQSDWYATWPADVERRALVVDYVKMWQKCH